MFYSVTDGEVWDDCEVWVTMRPATRVTQKTAARKVLLEWHHDSQAGKFNEDVAKSVATFFGRETFEDCMYDLGIVLSIFNGLQGPCCYEPMWSELCSLIQRCVTAKSKSSASDA
ncbi:unnamed protein product [Effrenium voratum]|uniref:Uncharacterized protein n=1 Tax=Effrenium voratum TaxID=2562239 RepID=A0AA36N019_9DINO|nr:unnamed protein product [Effrenium voratum]CAJ1429238.1 unnamed protein product [Effrenium voratum]